MAESNTPLVSVIIPAYNSALYIAETIDSVLAQTYKNWECIVVDNGSTDSTKHIVAAYVLKDKRIQYHYCKQNGVSFARNLAVKLSKGVYILPLDSDDKIGATYLEKAIHVIEGDPKLKLVYCDAELFGASTGKWILPTFDLKNMLIENSIFCSALYRKSDFEAVNGYNENMKEGFEDWDFWIKLLKDGSKVNKIPEILFYYRIRKNSRNTILDNEKQLRLRKQIYLNHKEVYDKQFELHELIYSLYLANTQVEKLKNTKDLKLGKMILNPLRSLKNIFFK